MNDFNIGFIGGLDGTKSKAKLNQDIDAIKKTLKELELKAKLDPNQVKSLETQLNTLKVNLTDVKFSQSALDSMVSQINNALKGIKIPSVNIGGNTSQQIGNNITQGFKQSASAIESFRKSLSNAGKSSSEIDNIVKKVQSLNVQIDSLRFSESTNGLMNVNVAGLDEFGNKVKITQTLLQDLQTMQWNVSSTTTSVVSTKELERINNAFTDYTAKLAQFKSTNTNILSGLTQPLADFESKLAGLKNGTVSIDEVKNAFKLLGTEASKITENFTGQLSKTDAAIRKLAQGNEIMDKLKASFKGLNNAPKEITKELTSVSKLLQNVKNIEAKEGRTANWSEAYRKWADEVDKLQAKLSVLQKQQANMTTPQIFKTSDLRSANIPYMTKVSNTIEKQMAEIQKMANAKGWQNFEVKGIEKADGQIKSLTLTVREADGALKQFQMQRAKLQGSGKAQTGLMQVGDVKVIETASQAQAKLAQQTDNANAKLQEQVNKIQLSMSSGGDTTTQIDILRNSFTKLGLSADEVKNKMNGVDTEVKELKNLMSNGASDSAITTQFERLQTVLSQTQNDLKSTRSEYSLLATEQQRLSLANTIEAWNQKNTAATKAVREENERYVISLRDLSNQMTRMDFNKINTGFKQNENSMRAMNRLGKSLKEQFKQAYESFTMWLSASSLVMKVVSETKQAITELKDVNTLLTEISKANDKLTKEQLAKIADDGFDTASKYGKKVTDYLSGVQEASRAGYKNAEAIAELSVAIQGAGDVTEDVANSYVIATDKAYKLGGSVEALTEVFDGTNKITNLNAVNMSELAEAMTIVGSTAASFGVEVDETTAAIATMSAVTQQSGSEVARAFRAILLNIRQVSDEEEGIDTEGLTKYEKACNALGVSLKETKNGVLETRDAMDVLKELSEEYVKLDENDLRRTELLNSVGGKVYHVI